MAMAASLFMNRMLSTIVWFRKDFHSCRSSVLKGYIKTTEHGFKKEICVENKWRSCLTATPNCVLFMCANCWITYCGFVLISFMVFLSALWGMDGWFWHTSPSLLKSLRPTSHLIIFSNDFGKCIRHSALLRLILNSVFFSFSFFFFLTTQCSFLERCWQCLRSSWGFSRMQSYFLSWITFQVTSLFTLWVYDPHQDRGRSGDCVVYADRMLSQRPFPILI